MNLDLTCRCNGDGLTGDAPDEDLVTLYAMLAEQADPGIAVTFYYPHLNQDMPAPKRQSGKGKFTQEYPPNGF